MTILLVDDDQDDAYIFNEAIVTIDPNIKCIHVIDGIEALQILEDMTVDIIFLDLNMPRMNGKECLEEIRKRNRLKDIPVIIYSTSPEMIEEDYMNKFQVITLKKDVSYLNSVLSIKQQLKDLNLL
jgi:CheY-like chemotaxis protein